MGNLNQSMIEKTIETSDFVNGGELNPEQQDEFVRLVKQFSTLIPLMRIERMKTSRKEVDKLWIGEPVTESATEATDTGETGTAQFNKVQLNSSKVKSAWNISTESLQDNIEQSNLEQTLMDTMVQRIATDLEDLAINGDDTLSDTSKRTQLLKTFDGLDKLTVGSHIVDAGGKEIQKGLFSLGLRRMPKQYRADVGMRWLLSQTIAIDWMDFVSDRGTVLGDQALQGAQVAPLGVPMVQIPLIPDDKPVSVSTATSAKLIGATFGPFLITAPKNTIKIGIDGNATFDIVITNGTLETVTIAKQINDALVADGAHGTDFANVARDDGDGRLVLESPTTGAASQIRIDTVPDTDEIYSILGLVLGTVTNPFPSAAINIFGSAPGNNTITEGSFIWLVNPKNFLWGILDGTRIFTEFNKDKDVIETVIYNQIATEVENIDAVVKIDNVGVRDLVL